MKKYLILFLILFMFTGCSDQEKEVVEEPLITPTVTPVPTYTDDNPIKVGLYMNGKIVSEYTTSFRNDKDIASFDVPT